MSEVQQRRRSTPARVTSKAKAQVQLQAPMLAAAGLVLAAASAVANPALVQGRALFTGEAPLAAKAPGGGPALSAAASRCSNCHAAPGVAGANPVPGAAGFGPRLNSAAMLQRQPRRGGPPSRYDAPALCRVLREGVDPAGVMLNAAMPRYTLSDVQCRALWTLLTSDL